MAGLSQRSKSLKHLLLLSWIAPAALTLVASLAVFLFLGWLDYQNTVDLINSDLREKSKIAARRVSAEILLEKVGAVDSVVRNLKTEFGLSNIVVSAIAKCGVENGVCSEIENGIVTIVRQVPQVNPEKFVILTQDLPLLVKFLNLKFLAWSTFPVFFLIVVGLVLQLIFLRRKIVSPVNALVGAGNSEFLVQDDWPIEVKHIAEELKAAFDTKEQAVFALLAKGVIHDIKTFMHSLLIATDLIGEVTDDSKRIRRLENLYNASKSNLPKIKRIIELTLDGSREIQIKEIQSNLTDTLSGAVTANSAYAKERNVILSLNQFKKIMAIHDPVQLERALANLIRNGIEAFASENATHAPLREVQISVVASNAGSIEIAVEDSGPGYDGDSNHFMPTKSSKEQGAGLGLYITQKIIQGHRGRLEVKRSTNLGGAKFSIFLPTGGVG